MGRVDKRGSYDKTLKKCHIKNMLRVFTEYEEIKPDALNITKYYFPGISPQIILCSCACNLTGALAEIIKSANFFKLIS
jgi:hypothetical protein